ncbi:MAG: ATP-binding protein [Myxococcaceae bacterium]|nr:ATP-binding protein [Myxococcaceae bacterium]
MIDLFRDLAGVPVHALRSFVTQRLSDRFPDRSVAMTADPSFDAESWAHDAGVPLDSPSPSTIVRAVHDDGAELRIGHFGFTWDDRRFDVVALQVPLQYESAQWTWVVSPRFEDFERLFPHVVRFNREVHGEVLVFAAGCFSKDASLQRAISATSFDDLILPEPLLAGLRSDVKKFLASRELYRQAGAVWKRGVLLLGPPGNGKTHAIKALVNEAKLPCVYVKSFTGRYTDPADAIPKVFGRARQLAPCVVVLEDLDALIDDENRSFLLNELDGFAANEGLITIATSNHPERLDPSLLHRPSRFDRKYRFELPGADLRHRYLGRWARQLPGGVTDEVLARAVDQTDEFTFAYLKELTLSTQMQWASEGRARAVGDVLLEVLVGLKAEIVAVASLPPPPERPAPPRGFRFPFG